MYLSENTFIGAVVGGVSQSSDQSSISATFVNMENWRAGRVICTAGTIAASSIVTFTLYEATAAAGTGSTAVSGKTNTLTGAEDNTVEFIEFDVGDLTAAYPFVGFGVAVSSGTAVIAAGAIELYNPRHAQETTAAS